MPNTKKVMKYRINYTYSGFEATEFRVFNKDTKDNTPQSQVWTLESMYKSMGFDNIRITKI